MKEYFKDWTFCKHFKFVTAFYAVLYALDLTIGFIIARKMLGRLEDEDKLDYRCKRRLRR